MSRHWSQRKGYDRCHELEGDYVPPAREDWDSLRRKKQKCESCQRFDELNGGCKMKVLQGWCENVSI